MKTLLLPLLLILALGACEDVQKDYVTTVESCITDTCYKTTKIVTHYNSSNNGAVGGGLLGGTAGWLIIGGPIGIVAGAITGAAVGSNPKATSWNETIIEDHCLYTIKCINNYSFKSDRPFSQGTRIDTRINNNYNKY